MPRPPARTRHAVSEAQGQAALLRGGFGFSSSAAALDAHASGRRDWGGDSRQYSLASITVMTRSVTVGSLGSGEW